MKFDFQSDIPLFQQVANQLEKKSSMKSKEEEIKYRRQLRFPQGYQINPATVLKGMNLLVSEQILEKRRGLGTFVAGKGPEKLS